MTDNNKTPFEQLKARRALLLDENRASMVEKRRRRGGRTARENLKDLLGGLDGIEYGEFTVAAQRSRRSIEDLQTETPGDGVLTVIGPVNADSFPREQTATALIVNDYSVLAGTQGFFHHKKINFLVTQNILLMLVASKVMK